MMRVLMALFVLMYISFFCSIVFKQKIGRCIPLSYVLISLLFYFSSFTGKLSNFKYLLLIFGLLSLIFVCLGVKKGKINIKKEIQKAFRPSAIIFSLFFVYLYFTLGNVELSNIDDLNFWGVKLLDMFRNDELYSVSKYAVYGVMSYPPFPFVMEGAIMKLLGGTDATNQLLAISSFSFSFFVPLLDKYGFKKNNLIKMGLVFLLSILTTLMIQTNYSMAYESYIYNSLYVDWVLSIVLAYGFSAIYSFDNEEWYSYLEIGVCSLILILTKQIGIALALLLWVTLYVDIAIKDKRIIIGRSKIIKYITLSIGVPLLFFLVWKLQIDQYIKNLSFSSSITNGLNEIVTSSGGGYSDFIGRFIYAYFVTPIFIHPFEISYFFLTVAITTLLILFGYLRKEERKYYTIPALYFLGSLGYALGIMLSYMFVFGSEGETLVMFGRYMQTYTYCGVVLLTFIFLKKDIEIKKMIVAIVVSLLFIEPRSVDTVLYKMDRCNYRSNQVPYIRNYLENEYNNQSMIVVNQTDIKYKALFRYLAQEKNQCIFYAQVLDETTFEEFKSWFNDKELLYIGDFDDRFLEYWEQISDLDPYNSSLYRIIGTDEGIKFELIYTWDEL